MNEHPILFSPPMVQAILEGRKTQTRRVVKVMSPRFEQVLIRPGEQYPYSFRDQRTALWNEFKTMDELVARFCPYGKPGDCLWVRETWAALARFDGIAPRRIPIHRVCYKLEDKNTLFGKWRPSIFMPRWASRITLEITDVRVERVQDISDADALAEGVPNDGKGLPALRFLQELWNPIYHPKPGDNPWVWVIQYKRLKQ